MFIRYCHFINRLALRALLVVMSFYVPTTFASDNSSDRENKIKIAYLFHFSQFTEWAMKLPIFNYCVYEDSHFAQLLKQAYAGKTLGSSQVDVQNVTDKSNLDECQLVYFPNQVSNELLTRIHNKPILSVGQQKNMIEQGIVYLFEDDQKIRFYINNNSAIAAGLKISSQLLSLSKEPPL